jgi:hypothetical protein
VAFYSYDACGAPDCYANAYDENTCDMPSACPFDTPTWYTAGVCNKGFSDANCAEDTPAPSPYTCGDVKKLYKDNSCCGNPSEDFVFPSERRLSPAQAGGNGDKGIALSSMRRALQQMKDSGSHKEIKQFSSQIWKLIEPYNGPGLKKMNP